MLDRCPDREGMLLRMKMFANGLHSKHVMLALCNSEEAAEKWHKAAGSNEKAVNHFYIACLNRTADRDGTEGLKDLFVSPGHQAVCSSLINSPEYSNFWGPDHIPGGGRGKNCKHGKKDIVGCKEIVRFNFKYIRTFKLMFLCNLNTKF